MKTIRIILIPILLLVLDHASFAQANVVSGQIVSTDDGVGLPGVTVLVKGTTIGTVTDYEGNYRLDVSEDDAVLVFSFVGYEAQEVTVGGRSTIDVSLDVDIESLEEVVVIGYGTQKKETLVSSVSTVKGEDLVKSPQPNLSNSFAGRVSGIIATTASGEPGFDGSRLLIRGQSSNGDNSPLIVVDGVISQLGGLERLDPNNIESVSVLKDASAAIYGSRAANGVILVTTKKGASGKPQFNLSYNQGFISPTRLPDMASSAQYAQILNEIQYYANRGGGLNQIYTEEEIQTFENGSDPTNYPNTDWLKDVISNNSTQSQTSLSVSGGSDNIQYFASLGSRKQESIYKNGITSFEQINLRTKLDVQATENLKLGTNINVRSEEGIYPTTGAQAIFRAAYRSKPIDVTGYDGVGYGVDAEGTSNNPLALVTSAPGKDVQPKTIINTILNFEYTLPFLKELSVKGFYAADRSTAKRKRFELPFNVYAPIDGTNPVQYAEVPNNIPSPQLLERQDNQELNTSHIALHYNKSFGDHYVSAFGAFEQSRFNSNYIEAFRRGFLSDAVDELNQGPVGVDENGSPYATNGGNSFEESRRNYFGRVAYDYATKYLVEAQVRYDGSSKFAEGNQYGFFWSSAVGWRVSEESFFNVSQINDLKLRASYGVIGNDRVPDFQFLNRYQNIGAGYVVDGAAQTRYVLSQIANRDITWEEAKKLDVGLEAKFLKNFSIEADYFLERRDGLLIAPGDLPWVSGIVNEWDATSSTTDNVPAIVPQANLGLVENRGFEVQASYSGILNQVNFFVSANMTYAKNEVVNVNDPEILEWKKAEGKQLNAALYYQAVGIFRTPEDLANNPSLPANVLGDLMYRDVDGDGEITANDQVRSDYTNVPQLVYGVTTGAEWKGFDFTVLIQGQGRSEQYFLPEAGTIGNLTKTWADNRYSPTNLTGSYPRAVSRTSSSLNGGNETRTDFWVVNTSFLRIRNVELGYSIPQNVLEKVKLKQARIYLKGLNLATFTSSNDFDPEVNNNQGHGYPQHRIYNIGATINF
ncbi:MAG: TonB-dependent receptor [Marinoscillum sp.]